MTESPSLNLYHQAIAAQDRKDNKAAAALLSVALQFDPEFAGGWYALAISWKNEDKKVPALAAIRRTLELFPDEPYSLTNAGWYSHLEGRYEEAIRYLERATDIAPDLPLGWANLALADMALGIPMCAMMAAEKALELEPSNSQYRMAYAFALLYSGEWAKGLKAYEARFDYRLPEFNNYPCPMWHGEDVDTLFVAAEQGLGDSIQFIRFLPTATKRAKKVIIGIQPELLKLMQYQFRRYKNVEFRAMPVPIPQADAFVPLLSLPVAMGFTDEELFEHNKKFDIPNSEIQVPKFKGRTKNIGICWAGSPDQDNDRHRSAKVEDFLELYKTPGVQLYSLQVGDRVREARGLDPLVKDLSPLIRDMTDTASIIGQLDAVVTVCTSVAHLSASLGKPTHIVLPRHGQHWLWRYDDTSPWYPPAQLYRQERGGDWLSVMTQVAEAL